MKEFLRILKYARPYLPKLLFGFFLILIIAQSQLVMPLVQRFVIDGILSDVRATELTHSVFGYHLTYSPTYWLIVILSSIIIFNALVLVFVFLCFLSAFFFFLFIRIPIKFIF